MLSDTPGLHHVTGLVGDPEAHADFYGGTLGLRLPRRTVNDEDFLQYHLYFGDATSSPGSVFTVFPDSNGDPGRAGKPGSEAVAFSVPPDSLGHWRDRLADRGVEAGPVDADARFGDRGLTLADPFGTRVELVETPDGGDAAEADEPDPWTDSSVPAEHAIRGLYGVMALPADPYGTASVLETLGFEYEAESGDRIRYRASGDRATVVDLLDHDAAYLREGPGTLHHAAVRVADREALLKWHELFRDRGYDVSRVTDRHFFHSLYVRGPGGLLVELAPGAVRPTWFPAPHEAPLSANEPSLTSAVDCVAAAVGVARDAGVPPERVVLVGVSQGGAVVAEFLRRRPDRYGGVFVVSAALPGDDLDTAEVEGPADGHGEAPLVGTPVALDSSEDDPCVPVERVRATAAAFERAGAAVECRSDPGDGHGLSDATMGRIGERIEALLGDG